MPHREDPAMLAWRERVRKHAAWVEQELRDNPNHPTNMYLEANVTDPAHGGKVTCYKCNGFIQFKDHEGYWDHQHKDEFPKYHFHKHCFNRYEHYYGLDRPLD